MGILLAVWTVEALPVAATAPVAANTEVADCSRRDTGEQLSGTVVGTDRGDHCFAVRGGNFCNLSSAQRGKGESGEGTDGRGRRCLPGRGWLLACVGVNGIGHRHIGRNMESTRCCQPQLGVRMHGGWVSFDLQQDADLRSGRGRGPD